MINFQKYKIKLIKLYSKFSIYKTIINNMSNQDLNFLYLLDSYNILIKLTYNKSNDFIYRKKITFNKNYFNKILYIYSPLLTESEVRILNNNKDFFFEVIYNKINFYDLDLNIRNRSLLTSFLHKNTINFINRIYLDKSDYTNKFKTFFKIRNTIYRKISNKNLHGVMFDTSFNLKVHNIRGSNDYDLIILHPYYYSEKIKKKLQQILKHKLIDGYIYGLVDWHGVDKTKLNTDTQIITKNKLKDYFELIFNPNYHYYFYGLKVIDFYYDLNYRINRAFPKNVSDILLIKNKLNINVPKFNLKINPRKKIKRKNKIYTYNKFFKVAYFYYNKVDNRYKNYNYFKKDVLKLF